MGDADGQLDLTASVASIDAARAECVPPEASIRDVVKLLVDKNRGAALICRQDQLLGIFTERDALRLMAELAAQPSRSAGDQLAADPWSRPISEVMTERPLSISRDETVASAIAKMAAGGYRRLPIVDEASRPVAVVKVTSILSYLVEHFPKVVYTLPPKPHHKMQEREGA
jgi:CBS domain-containing protein